MLPNIEHRVNKVLNIIELYFEYEQTSITEYDFGYGYRLWIKDESTRLNMGSFKGLGGIFSVAMTIIGEWRNRYAQKKALKDLLHPQHRQFLSSITIVCASAGNHGIAVAMACQRFAVNCRVHLCSKVPQEFQYRLKRLDAEVVLSGDDYEQSIECAYADAENLNAVFLPDGDHGGKYAEPIRVMQGYAVIAHELMLKFQQLGEWPSHVFLQAGVGSFAASQASFIRQKWDIQPEIWIVEPDEAACLAMNTKSLLDNNEVIMVNGKVSSMARLDCKIPSLSALAILQQSDVNYLSITDQEAATAKYLLKARNISTTDSGAAGFAGALKFYQKNAAWCSFSPLIIVTESHISPLTGQLK